MTMHETKRTMWETYARAWKEPTRAGKAAALAESNTEDCVYTDPLTKTSGHDELIAYMLDFHKQVPGGHFLTTYFLTHHDVSIARWSMADGSGAVIGEGISYAVYAEDGRLTAITGFFEQAA